MTDIIKKQYIFLHESFKQTGVTTECIQLLNNLFKREEIHWKEKMTTEWC